MNKHINKKLKHFRKKMKNMIGELKKAFESEKSNVLPFSFGGINPDRGRILILIVLIIFMITGMVFDSFVYNDKQEKVIKSNNIQKKNIVLEKEISKLVQGYPIERMTSYISQKDPKVAAFMIAIAKKESNWGKRKPVLAGNDCYNYWGFRLKTDKMGSAGHTCFDSPREAVNIVAARLDELVNKEKIDSPKEMVVWKCGYGCQDESKSNSEQKWISDVDYYYSKLSDYL